MAEMISTDTVIGVQDNHNQDYYFLLHDWLSDTDDLIGIGVDLSVTPLVVGTALTLIGTPTANGSAVTAPDGRTIPAARLIQFTIQVDSKDGTFAERQIVPVRVRWTSQNGKQGQRVIRFRFTEQHN